MYLDMFEIDIYISHEDHMIFVRLNRITDRIYLRDLPNHGDDGDDAIILELAL